MKTANSYRWTILALGTFCILTYGVVFQSIPPLIGILVEIFDVSYARAGALMGLFIVPAIFLSIPGGMLTDRFGPRSVGVASLLSLTIGTVIVASGGSYWIIAFGRLVAGIGACVLLVVAPKIVASWFYEREIGLAMGIFNISMPLGTILSLNFMGTIAFRFNWQASIWVSFAVGVAALGLFLLLYRSKSTVKELKPEQTGLLAAAKKAGASAWLVGLSWGFFNAGLISFFTYAPDYFISQGENIGRAGLLASYPMWGSIVLAPIVGLLIDRMGHKWIFVSIGCGGMALFLYLIPEFHRHAAIFSISIGVFVAVLTPAIFSLPAELLPESVMGFGFGILGTGMGIGTSVGPLIVGSLRDATGDYLWSFAAMALFSAGGIIPMSILGMKKQRRQQ